MSILSALPTGSLIIQHVRAIEALLPQLTQDIAAAQKAGVVTLARAFVVMHRLNERMLSEERAFKPFREAYRTFKELTMPEACEQAGLENVPLSEGYRVGTSTTIRASIRPDMKQEAFVWLMEHQNGDVIQETVNASTLSALARELREVNVDLPEDLFNVADVNNTSVTKIK